MSTVLTERPPTAPPRTGRHQLTGTQRWTRRGPLLPALILVILVTQIPFLLTVWYSFRSRNLLRPGSDRFSGLDNYAKVFTDPLFRNAIINTVVLTASTVILALVLGVALAVLLDKRFLGRSVVRTMLITPFLVMPAAAALLWKTSFLNPVFAWSTGCCRRSVWTRWTGSAGSPWRASCSSSPGSGRRSSC